MHSFEIVPQVDKNRKVRNHQTESVAVTYLYWESDLARMGIDRCQHFWERYVNQSYEVRQDCIAS